METSRLPDLTSADRREEADTCAGGFEEGGLDLPNLQGQLVGEELWTQDPGLAGSVPRPPSMVTTLTQAFYCTQVL